MFIYVCIYTCIYEIGKVVVSESIIIDVMGSAIRVHQIIGEIVFRHTSHR